MLRILLVVIGGGLLYWLYSKKNHLFQRYRPVVLDSVPIQGTEVRAFLDIHTPLECLQDDGIRFGQSFQMKAGPMLPHNPQCRCELVSLSWTSPEVFKGALDTYSVRETALGPTSPQEAKLLKRMLLGLYERPLPLNFETFCRQFNLHELKEDLGTPWMSLIKQRFEQISIPPVSQETERTPERSYK